MDSYEKEVQCKEFLELEKTMKDCQFCFGNSKELFTKYSEQNDAIHPRILSKLYELKAGIENFESVSKKVRSEMKNSNLRANL